MATKKRAKPTRPAKATKKPARKSAKTPAKKSPGKKAAAKKTAAPKSGVRKAAPGKSALDRTRQFCLSLPETTEVEAWGAPTFRVKGKIFAWYVEAGGHHGPRPALWILSVSLDQDLMLRVRPDRYFKPPYVGPSGWIGAYMDQSPPWQEIEELLRDGWRRRAPKKLATMIGS